MFQFPHQRRKQLLACFNLCALALGGSLLASCTLLHHPKKAVIVVAPAKKAAPPAKAISHPRTIERPPATPEARLGTVRVIGAHGNFVLIETPSAAAAVAVPPGHILHCRPAGTVLGSSSADLRVSPERRPPFLVADVLSGTPAVGDVAYLAQSTDTPVVPLRPVVPFSSVIPAAAPSPTPEAMP